MARNFRRFFFLLLVLSLLVINISAQEQGCLSRFGKYSGYSEEVYDSWVRSSQYLAMRDGVKLAIDIIRPAKKGKVEEKALPVLWTHTRYRRAFVREGQVRSAADSRINQYLLKHGYVIAVADVRGAGASFGSYKGTFTKEETQDAYEITEWLASQPWCDGNIGMTGGSYLGITQLMAASTNPPHLKAIFPMVALFDLYSVIYHGGVLLDDFIKTWDELTRRMDTETVAAQVDEDKDGKLLQAAIEEHKSGRSISELTTQLKFRNSLDEVTGARAFYEWQPAGFIPEVNQSGVPIYLWCGWFDSFTRDGFLMFRNFNIPKKMVIGAWSHAPRDPDIAQEDYGLLAVEELRWFDYWLKGIDNGIMDEAPLTYQLMKEPKNNEWRTAAQWPLPEEKPTKYYFQEVPSGSESSANERLLSEDRPLNPTSKDDYKVDYTTTSGQETRWDNAVGGEFNYPDMTPNDKKGLTYTTEPLAEDIEITGHPVVHLWVSSTATDGDFFVYLEEVDGDGISHYVSEGTLRASHRALHKPNYDNLGLPFHRSHDEDIMNLTPGEPAELIFDLQPTSNVFDLGHRIRITLTCADKDNALTPELSPPPTVTIYRNKKHASFINLPIISPEKEKEFPLSAVIIIVLVVVILVIVFTLFLRRKTV